MSKRLPVLLSAAEVESILDAARAATDSATTDCKQHAAWRDFVMIHTGLKAGARVAELCSLEVPDVDLAGAMLAIKHGKGDKDRNVPIGKRLLTALREWIGERTTGYVFEGPRGKRLSRRTFQVRLDALARRAGVKRKVHPHLMRHVFACMLLRSGADIREVQELMGHANLATTAIYLHVDTSRLKAVVDRL